MFNRISNEFIQELLIKTEIVDLINNRFFLKKSGKNYYALCPFHKEKTPSFFVNKKKQYYHCFGCGAHGNVIDFLMNYNKFSFIDSIKELANINGISLKDQSKTLIKQNKGLKLDDLYKLMDDVKTFFQNSLNKLDSKNIKEYLFSRGLNEKVIRSFSIGFAPVGSNSLLKYFNRDIKNCKNLYLLGMILKNKDGSFYEFFRYRIIFPIRDLKGRVVAFGGRVLGNKKPKYINSPETKIFKKSRLLYGLYEVIQNNVVCSKLLVVEGYMDVISLSQFDINYAVSSLGTSTTKEHIKLLFQMTKTIICCYDGDMAGKEAAWRTLKISLPYLKDGYNIKFMFLLEGEDPDSLIRKEGKLGFEKRIYTAKLGSRFLLDSLMKKNNLSSCEGKANFTNVAVYFVKKISGNFLRLYLLKKIAILTGIPDIFYFFRKINNNKLKKSNNQDIKIKLTTVRILVSLLIKNPNFVNLIKNLDQIKNMNIFGLNIFLDLVKFCQFNPNINTAQLLESHRDHKFFKYFKKLSIWDDIKFKNVERKVFKDSLKHLFKQSLNERLNFLIEKDKRNGLSQIEKKEVCLITFAKIRQ